MNKRREAGFNAVELPSVLLGSFVFFICLSVVLAFGVAYLWHKGAQTTLPLPFWGLCVLLFVGSVAAFARWGMWAEKPRNRATQSLAFGYAWIVVLAGGWLIIVAGIIGLPIVWFLRKH